MKFLDDSTKRTLLTNLLAETAGLIFRVDARVHGVVIPDHVLRFPNTSLGIGYTLLPPHFNVTLDDTGLSGVLSFNEEPFRGAIPWAALWAVQFVGYLDDGFFWPESFPPEIHVSGFTSAAKTQMRKTAHDRS